MLIYITLYYFISIICSESASTHSSSRLDRNPTSFTSKEVTLESLNLKDEDIITTSKLIDVNAELSAVSRKTYKNSPAPESVRLTHDLASEIERLRNINFEEDLKQYNEPELNYKDGISIKKPLPESDVDIKRIDDYLIIYKNIFAYVPTLLLILVSLPAFSYFVVYGREVSRYSIRSITAFVIYFATFNTLRSVYIIAILLSIVLSVFSYSIALKPLKHFNFGPRSIRKEPVGWIFTILFTCAVFSNLIYKVLYILLQALIGDLSVPRFIRATVPTLYAAFLIVLSAAVLALLILAVPTRYAQNSVFSLSSSYILLSCVSYINDFLVYNFSTRLKPIRFDLTQFFDSSVSVSIGQILMILGTLTLAVGTTFLTGLK